MICIEEKAGHGAGKPTTIVVSYMYSTLQYSTCSSSINVCVCSLEASRIFNARSGCGFTREKIRLGTSYRFSYPRCQDFGGTNQITERNYDIIFFST